MRALLRLHNEEAQVRLIKDIAQKNLSVKATEDLMERMLNKLYGEEEPSTSGQHVVCIMRDFRICKHHQKALSKIKKSESSHLSGGRKQRQGIHQHRARQISFDRL